MVTCELSTIAPPETLRLNRGVCHLLPSSVPPHSGSCRVRPAVDAAVGTAQTSGESTLSPPVFIAVTAAKTGVPLVSANSVAPGSLTVVFVLAVVTGVDDELYTL